MMKDDYVYLGHMFDFTMKVLAKIKGVSSEDWNVDENLRYTVVHLIQNIGEAARRVSETTREKHTNIPWSEVIGMRHRIVHNYVQIKLNIVWDVAKYELPKLAEKLEKIVPPEDIS